MVLVLLVGCATGERPVILIGSGDLVYPQQAKAEQIEGKVIVRYDVSAEGVIANIEIIESEPPGIFDEAVLAYVRTWRFTPATKNGEPVVERGLESTIALSLEKHLPF